MISRRSDRWIVFRFVFGCASRPIAGIDTPSNVTQTICTQDDTKKNDSCIIKKTKHPLGLIKFRRANISHGIQRLFRNLKNASKIFVYKNEMDDENEHEDEDEDESDMEIGYPTDVKHLTHIGWDGSTTVSKSSEQCETLTPSEIISFPSISLKQFEAAMAQQAAGARANINNNTNNV